MIDFATADISEIANFAAAHAGEFNADIDALDIIAAVNEGRSVLVRRPYGFAVVQIVDRKLPHLWLIYVHRDQRGRRLGRRFVRELLDEFSKEHHMTLRCAGGERSRFFGRCGFVVESRDGDWRRMTTDREHWRWK